MVVWFDVYMIFEKLRYRYLGYLVNNLDHCFHRFLETSHTTYTLYSMIYTREIQSNCVQDMTCVIRDMVKTTFL